MNRFLATLFLISAALAATACQSTDMVIDENLSPGEYFQEAEKASSEYQNYELALKYYNTFIERYPDEATMRIEAEYEIALLYHKMGNDETALNLFQGILDKYQQPEAAVLPAWPEVLSKKLIDNIRNAQATATASGEAPPAVKE